MAIEVVADLLEEDIDEVVPKNAEVDPDSFFSKNAFRMVYQTNNFFLPQIKDLIDRGEVLNIRPEYQRRLRWSVAQKSRLIESLLLNIPVPPVFFYESTAARYEVMDGQQRLNAVKEFLAGDFVLSGLPVLHPLNGLRYTKCPPRIKRALERASLSAIVLLLESDSDRSGQTITIKDIRRFIFDRLNTGGTKLNPQEIRNALNPGEFNKLIISLTRFRQFTDVFGIPPYVETDPNEYYENPERQKNRLYSSMADCQLVLRYFALRDPSNIRGSMKGMLDRAMEQSCSVSEAEALQQEFQERFVFLVELFDSRPFRLPPTVKGGERVSAAIYDSAMVALNEVWSERARIMQDKVGVQQRMSSALNTQSVGAILTGQANTSQAVRDRIQTMKSILISGQ